MVTFSNYVTLVPFTGWALLCYAMNLPNVCIEQYQQSKVSWGNLHIKTSWLSAEATLNSLESLFPGSIQVPVQNRWSQISCLDMSKGDNYVVKKYAVRAHNKLSTCKWDPPVVFHKVSTCNTKIKMKARIIFMWTITEGNWLLKLAYNKGVNEGSF